MDLVTETVSFYYDIFLWDIESQIYSHQTMYISLPLFRKDREARITSLSISHISFEAISSRFLLFLYIFSHMVIFLSHSFMLLHIDGWPERCHDRAAAFSSAEVEIDRIARASLFTGFIDTLSFLQSEYFILFSYHQEHERASCNIW